MGGHLKNSYSAKEKFIMKLFSLALVAGVTIAQKKKPNYPGSRPVNKPVKKPGNNKPYKRPTAPPKPPPIYAGTGGGANAAQNQGSPYADAYGDPHFMVATLGQEPICFDYNPPAGSEMTLIMDPDSGLHISAKVDGRRQGKTRFMTNVHIASPLGAQLTIDERGVTLAGLPSWVDAVTETEKDDGSIEYGDITYSEVWSEDGSRDKITVQIEDGPRFLIKEKALRETVSFGVTDSTGISPKSRGVIGQFIRPGAYTIEKSEESEKFATVNIDDYKVEAVWEPFHRNTQCWTIEEDDLIPLFSNSK